MNYKEIERKFLVLNQDFKELASEVLIIKQGYLNSEEKRCVRIRLVGEKGFITVKGISTEGGLSRFEWEKEISAEEAQHLINLCEPGIIEKTRYVVEFENHKFEIDEFGGLNAGLVVAEIELQSEAEHFIKPPWLGKEVTGNQKYYNASLSKYPYTFWQEAFLFPAN